MGLFTATADVLASLQQFGLAPPEGALAPFKFVLGVPQDVTVQQILRGTARRVAVAPEAQPVGLFSTILGGAARLFGAAAPVAARAVAPAGRIAGRALQGRVGQVGLGLAGAVAGGAAFEAGIQAFAGDGAVPGLPPGVTPLASLTGGRFLVADANGARIVVGRNGRPIKPQILVPSGMPLPANVSSIVFISADGQTIGVTIKRRRRRLNGELRRVFSTIDVAERITKRLERRTRRRS